MDKSILNVFNALEANDFKRSHFLCEKYLKKASSNKLLQILMAFSLSSLGKEHEASHYLKAILESPKEELPSDSQFVNTIIMTFKKMRKIPELCPYLDYYCILYPNSEDLLVEYFFVLVHCLEFKKANLVALKLFKKTQVDKYFIWAILTLYNQAQIAEKKSSEEVSLDLIKIMIKKAISEGRLKSFQDYCICMLLPDKDPSILTMLSSIPDNIFPTFLDAIKWKVQLLSYQKEFSGLVSYCRGLETPLIMLDDWELITSYLQAVISLSDDPATFSMTYEEIFFWDKDDLPDSKKSISTLSHIEYSSKIKDLHLLGYLAEYFELFGHKDSCFSYLQPYLQSDTSFSSFIESKIKSLLQEKTNSENCLQKLLTAFKINEYYSQTSVIPTFSISYDEYIYYYIQSKLYTSKPICDFIILAIFSIFREHSKKQNLQEKGPTLDHALFSLPYCHLLNCVTLLLLGLQDDDSNFILKLIAIFLLRDLGVVSLAVSLYNSLNIKFIQLDILSYVIYDWIPLVGFKDEVAHIQSGLTSLYLNNDNETPELVIEAFKYGSFSQVPEFVDLHLQLKYSIQRKICEITTIQSACLQLSSKTAIEQYFAKLKLPVIFKTIVDNRPFIDLFPTWDGFPLFTSLLKKFSPKDTSWIETCYAILLAMKSCFVFSHSLDDLIIPPDGNSDELILSSQLCTLLKELTTEYLNLEPLIFSLLNVVKEILNKNYLSSVNWILKLVNIIKTQLSEDGFTFSSTLQTPDVMLVKIEGYVEILHYFSIFLTGLSKKHDVFVVQDQENSDSRNPNSFADVCQSVCDLIPEIINFIDSVSVIKLPSSDASLKLSDLITEHKGFLKDMSLTQEKLFAGMQSDWVVIIGSAKSSIRQSHKIVRSFLY